MKLNKRYHKRHRISLLERFRLRHEGKRLNPYKLSPRNTNRLKGWDGSREELV